MDKQKQDIVTEIVYARTTGHLLVYFCENMGEITSFVFWGQERWVDFSVFFIRKIFGPRVRIT